jgi:hypothetical protein
MSLELRGAYSDLLDALYDRDGLFPDNDRLLAELWEVNIQRAGRLKRDLILRGKIHVLAGQLLNHRVTAEVESWRNLRTSRQLGGKNNWKINGRLPGNKNIDISKKEFDKDVANLAQYRERLEGKVQQ